MSRATSARWPGRRALALALEHGLTAGAIFARLVLALTARRRGRLDEAEELLHVVHAAHGSSPREPGTTFAELGVAALAGDPERAAVLLGAAAAAREGAGTPLPDGERGDVDRIRAAVVAVTGEEAFSGAHERGRVAGPHLVAGEELGG